MSRITCLRGEMTVARIAAQRELLLQALHEHDAGADGDDSDNSLVLDLAAVEAIDSAGLQLLLALKRSLMQRAARLVLTHVPSDVAEALDVFGLRERLQDVTGAIA